METYLNSENVPTSPREYLTLGPSTQTSVDLFSDGVIQSVQSGEINPLTVLIQLRAIQKASERILKEINVNIMNEADKYPTNEFEFMGNKITKTEHGTKYNFEACGDPDWEEWDVKEKSAANFRKEREQFLKAMKASFSLLDKRTGEVVEIHPPTKKSTSGLNVSIR